MIPYVVYKVKLLLLRLVVATSSRVVLQYMFRSLVPISIQTVFPEDGTLAPKHVGDTSLIEE